MPLPAAIAPSRHEALTRGCLASAAATTLVRRSVKVILAWQELRSVDRCSSFVRQAMRPSALTSRKR